MRGKSAGKREGSSAGVHTFSNFIPQIQGTSNFSYVIYFTEEVYEALKCFFTSTQTHIPSALYQLGHAAQQQIQKKIQNNSTFQPLSVFFSHDDGSLPPRKKQLNVLTRHWSYTPICAVSVVCGRG